MDKRTCPHCGNPDCIEDDTFCFNCGKPLDNFCTDPTCQLSEDDSIGLIPTAVFCPDCGSQSTFAQDGFISPKSFDPQ